MVNPAVYMDHEDCQGQPQKYWRASGTVSNGEIVLGYGQTKQEAENDAQEKVDNEEVFLALEPVERLRVLLSKKERPYETLCHNDMDAAIRLIAEILRVDKS